MNSFLRSTKWSDQMDQNLAVSNHGGCSVVVAALVLSFACGQIVSQFTFDQVKKVTAILVENSRWWMYNISIFQYTVLWISYISLNLDRLLFSLQVVIVGNGAVGKSSMIQRYCKGIFTRNYKKTIGVDFLEKHIT